MALMVHRDLGAGTVTGPTIRHRWKAGINLVQGALHQLGRDDNGPRPSL
jgi:hypothetical protein